MRGVIFRTYMNFIQDNFGYEKLDEILQKDNYPNKGGFSTAGNYSTAYLSSLISSTEQLFEGSKDKTIEAFGFYAFKHLLDRFTRTYQGKSSPLHTNSAYDFLQNLNIIHFIELQKLYPDAIFPKFDIERLENEHIVIKYCSYRNMPYLVNGLIKGCLAYYNDSSTLTMQSTDRYKVVNNKKQPVYEFEVRKNG
jgi:hypothetical protein